MTAVLASGGCKAWTTETESDPPRPTSTPMVDEGPPADVVAIMTCYVGVGRQLPDGTHTRGLTETLVVRRDGAVELRDTHATGRVLASTVMPPARIRELDAIVTRPDWASLVHVRGAAYPDGASCEIVAGHRRVKRFDDPEDEPIVKVAWAKLRSMWAELDRLVWVQLAAPSATAAATATARASASPSSSTAGSR